MANVYGLPTIELKLTLELDEAEARALFLICDYNHEEFLKMLHPHIGERLVDKHKKGILSLLKTARPELDKWLLRVNRSREVFTKVDEE